MMTAAAGDAGLLSYSTFTATFGIPLTSYVPEVGPQFQMLAAEPDVYQIGSPFTPVQNVAAKTGTGVYAVNYAPIVVDVLASDVKITSDIVFTTTHPFQGVAFRGGTGATPDFWFFQINGSDLKIYYWTGAGFDLVDTLTGVIISGTYAVRIELVGSNIKCYFEEGLIFDITDTRGQSNTRHGIFNYLSNPRGYWKYFKVESI